MGLFKLGLFLIILQTLFAMVLLPVSTLARKPSEAKSQKAVLGAKPAKPIHSTNLTLDPPDQINVTPVVIIEIVDTDSVRVLLNDGMEVVDLIGIKIPTSTSQKRYDSCFEETIEESIQKMALGKKAFMIDDKTYDNNKTSKKYLFLEDLTFLNLELIKQGFTNALLTENYLYREDFSKARQNAEDKSIGVWHDECPVVKPSETKQAKSTPTPTTINPYAHLIPTSTPKPTSTPTPTTVQAFATQQTSSNKPSSLNPEILFVLINNHRQSMGKPPFEKEERLCSLAKERGPELYDEIFVTHNVHAGLESRNLPYWITENMAHYSTEEQVFNWWMGSTIHRRAIEGNSKYSCGECYGNSCAQLFTSYEPK